MYDGLGRRINYLRVSVTDRCSLRCIYCMPPEGVPLVARADILRLEEIARVIRASALAGINKVRFTGGEPLLRKGVRELISACSSTPGIDDVSLTTNGVLLVSMAKELKEAGLRRVNISLDTLNPRRFAEITRGGELAAVLEGIEYSLALGLHPVKLNMVVMRGINDDEILDMARLTLDRPLHVRFIELMPIGPLAAWAAGRVVLADEIKEKLQVLGPLQAEKRVTGGGPARYFSLPGSSGTIGFITAMSDHFCPDCDRLRLTAGGFLRPCLYHTGERDLKVLVRAGAGLEELAGVFREAALAKPAGHNLAGGWLDNKSMSEIGG